jgi:cytochrome c biogenesis protein CcdA
MDLLNQILENSTLPFLSAFVLGLMTAISPCPLATNITAIGFIGRDLSHKRRVFINGLVYTLGRAISYFTIGLIFYLGASQFEVSAFLQNWGEKILGPLLIVIGVFMLGWIKINLPGIKAINEKLGEKARSSYVASLLLGILFALAFCPYSGVLFFGLLIPMTIGSASGLYLPLIFALATGIPVIIIAWLLAYSLNSVGGFYAKLKNFEQWFRRIVAVLFIAVGIYYTIITFF